LPADRIQTVVPGLPADRIQTVAGLPAGDILLSVVRHPA
jgi:hypothetical protein